MNAPAVPRALPDALVLDTDPHPRMSARLAAVLAELSGRDLAVLRSLAALGLMTTGQVQRLHFAEGSDLTQARRARRCLERLHTHRLLARLTRRVGGVRAGSAGQLHTLSTNGRRLIGLPTRAGATSVTGEPAGPKVAHTLAVADLAVTLHEAHRAGVLDLVRFETEPTCWRTWTGPAGETRHLRPDAFAIVARGQWEHLWFLEADMGTERPHRLRGKAALYRTYAQSGQEQERWGTSPLVAYLTNVPGRRDTIADHIGPDPFAVVALFSDVPDILATDHTPGRSP